MCRDTSEYVAQPEVRSDVVLLAHGEQRVDDGFALDGIVTSGNKIILPAKRNGTDGILDEVIVDLQPSVVQIGRKLRPANERITDRFAPSLTWKARAVLEPGAEGFQDRGASSLRTRSSSSGEAPDSRGVRSMS